MSELKRLIDAMEKGNRFSKHGIIKMFDDVWKENAELSAKIGQLESQSVHIYNTGYHAGHNDTVEGCYTDIVSADMDTYHANVVRELREDLLAEVQK